jgi:disulfide bond formation protein DsbB
MCLWQRWPHGGAILAGLLALALPMAIWLVAGALSALTTAGIGIYHTGVERAWWEGPSSCTGDAGGLSGLTGADLLSTENAAPLVLCDEVAWAFAGLSMASWNALFSLALAAIWIVALKRTA